MKRPPGAVAVIFLSRRNRRDPEGYRAASSAMEAEAARQPGYLGFDSVRDGEGGGITISWWASDAAARAWRAKSAHRAIQARGRSDWYDAYSVAVAEVTRAYAWERDGDARVDPAEPQENDMPEQPDTTTGAPIVNIAPPVPDALPDVGKPPQMDGIADEAERDTAVQGSPEE